MFPRFHKSAHEWLGWAMVVAVGLHLINNMKSFKRYFAQTTGQVVIALFVAVLTLSFIGPNGQDSKPPFVAPINALAQVAGISTAQLREKLANQGITSQSDNQTVIALVGADQHRQMETLGQLFQAQDVNPAK